MKPTYTLKQILLVCFSFVFTTDLLGQCIADFKMSQSAVACEKIGVNFTYTGIGAIRRAWNFGDGSTILTTPSPSHAFTTSGTSITYNGSLSITCTGGVISSKTFSVTVNPKPVVSFTKNKTEACTFSDNVIFTSGTLDPSNTYLWEFGDGATSTDAIANHTFNSGATFPVSLKITSANGCSNTRTDSILVKPSPNPDFRPSAEEGCVPLPIEVTNVTQVETDSITNWKWDYGDGTIVTVKNPSLKVYTKAGNYSLLLYATNTLGCTNTSNWPISVSDKPTIAGITAPVKACPNELFTLSMVSASPSATYSWDLGTGAVVVGSSTATTIQVYWTTGGIKRIKGIVTNNTCSDSKEVLLYVSPELNPFVSYSDGKSSACKGDSKGVTIFPLSLAGYTFRNASTNAIVQQGLVNTLNFNALSTNINYSITVQDEFGCVFTANPGIAIAVYEIPKVVLTSNLTATSDICFNNSVTYTANSTISGLKYSFFYGDTLAQLGSSSAFTTQLKLFKNTVYVEADNNGCTSISNTIESYTRPQVDIPILNCGRSGNDFVVAKWTPSLSITGYEIEVDGSGYLPPTSGTLGLSHTVTGLSVGDSILLKVKAYTSSDCEPIIYSSTVKCYSIPCQEISADISSDKSLYCHGDTALLSLTNIVSISTLLGVVWNNQQTGLSVRVPLTTSGENYLARISIRDSSQSLKCPLYNYSKNIKKNPALDFTITTKTLEYNDLTINPFACVKKKVKLSVSPANYDTYNFYLDSLGKKSTLLQSSSSPDFIVTDVLSSKIGSIKVEVLRVGCSNSKSIETECLQLYLVSTVPSCVSKSDENKDYSFGITPGFDYYYVYDRSQPIGDQLIYQGPQSSFLYQIQNRYAILQVLALLALDTIKAQPVQIKFGLNPELNVTIKENFVKCGYLDVEMQAFPILEGSVYSFTKLAYDSTSKKYIDLLIPNTDGYIQYSQKYYEDAYSFNASVTRDKCSTFYPITLFDRRFQMDKFKTKVGSDSLLCSSDFEIVPSIIDWQSGEKSILFTPPLVNPFDEENYKKYKYSWSNGDTTKTAKVLNQYTNTKKAYLYTFTRKIDGCVLADTAINLFPKMIKHEPIDFKLCINMDSLQVVSIYNDSYPLKSTHKWATSGSWLKNASADTLVFPKQPASYVFQDTVCTFLYQFQGPNSILSLYKVRDITDYNLCMISCGKEPIVPNVITPNDDQRNDTWVLKEFNGNVKIKIFNRWGEEVYKDDNYKNNWSGKNQGGLDLANGIYFYVIQPEGGSFYAGLNATATPIFSCEAKPYSDLKGTILIDR